jgi:hypothetical protein
MSAPAMSQLTPSFVVADIWKIASVRYNPIKGKIEVTRYDGTVVQGHGHFTVQNALSHVETIRKVTNAKLELVDPTAAIWEWRLV